MFLWHFPSGRPAPPLAGIPPEWSSDFPPPDLRRAAAQPSCARLDSNRPLQSAGPPKLLAGRGRVLAGSAAGQWISGDSG